MPTNYASPSHYFEGISAEANPQAVKLATDLIERESGRFEPEKMPDQFADAIRELIQAKVENRAPEVVVASEGKPAPQVINIMAALKESMEAKGRSKVRDAVRKRMGKQPEEEPVARPARPRPSPRRTPLNGLLGRAALKAQATSLSFGSADFRVHFGEIESKPHPPMGSLQKASLHNRVCRLGGERHAPLGIFTALFRISRHTRSYADTLSLTGLGRLRLPQMKKPQRRGGLGASSVPYGGNQ